MQRLLLVVLLCTATFAQIEIKLGGLLSFTGSQAIGNDLKVASDLALEDANRLAPRDYQFTIVYYDTKSDPNVAVEQTGKLINDDKVAVIIGPGLSNEALASFPVARNASIPMIGFSVTTPLFTALPGKDGYWNRVCPSDTFQGRALSDMMEANGYHQVALLHTNDAYGIGIAETFSVLFTGTEPINFAYDSGQNNITEIVTQLKASDAQVLIMALLLADTADFLNELAAQNYTKKIWITDSSASLDLVEANYAGLHTIGVAGTKPATLGTSSWKQRIMDNQAGKPVVVYQAEIYDSVMIAAQAIINAQTTEAEFLVPEIAAVGLLYEGQSGTITFDENGDRIGGTYDVFQWQLNAVDGNQEDCEPIQRLIGLWSLGMITIGNLNQNLITCGDENAPAPFLEISAPSPGKPSFQLYSSLFSYPSSNNAPRVHGTSFLFFVCIFLVFMFFVF